MKSTIITLKDAFIKDIEIMFGYICMGFVAGILLSSSGYSYIYALLMSVFVYSGIMQFMVVSIFSADISLSNIFVTTLIVNLRQSFYTIIMLKEFRNMDKKRFLSIFWLTDETFALLTTKKPNKDSNKNLFIFFVGMLNHIYWIVGCLSGALFGGLIKFDTRGIDFIMSAIFVVIFITQWQESKSHIPALLGIFFAILWLLVIGKTYFLLASLLSIIVILLLFQKWINNGY